MNLFHRLRNLWALSAWEVDNTKDLPVGTKVSPLFKVPDDKPKMAQIVNMKPITKQFLEKNPPTNE